MGLIAIALIRYPSSTAQGHRVQSDISKLVTKPEWGTLGEPSLYAPLGAEVSVTFNCYRD